MSRFGASYTDWQQFAFGYGLLEDLVPAVMNPGATISGNSSLQAANLGKVPSIYNSAGLVTGIPGWTSALTSVEQIKQWSDTPDYGICVICRQVTAIDIDVDDLSTADHLLSVVVSYIELTTGLSPAVRKRANSPRTLVIYRNHPEAESTPKTVLTLAGDTSGAVEVLGASQQFVACGQHRSGVHYEWNHVVELPILTVSQAAELINTIASVVNVLRRTDSRADSSSVHREPLPPGVEPSGDMFDRLTELELINPSPSPNGGYNLLCPNRSAHSSNTDWSTTTQYFPAGVGGYAREAIVCLHAHCMGFSSKAWHDMLLPAVDDFIELEAEPVAAPAPTGSLVQQSYPVELLPPLLRDAMNSAVERIQAPLPIIAAAALTAIATASQGAQDIMRDGHLIGPTSLYFLTIALSGERKTTCDSYFMAGVHKYEVNARKAMEPAMHKHRSEYAIWKTKYTGHQRKLNKMPSAETHEVALQELAASAPVPPVEPRVAYVDVTREALAFGLSRYPSAVLCSSEGGTIFGGSSMNADNLTGTLAFYNTMWSEGTMAVDRRSGDSFRIDSGRLSIGVMVQPSVFTDMSERGNGSAKDTGFFSRFLTAWPESRIGSREYRPSSDTDPAREAFAKRIEELLNESKPVPNPITGKGELNLKIAKLSSEAQALWIDYFNSVERNTAQEGIYHGISEIAGKSAEQAVRLAAVLSFFEHGYREFIDARSMEQGILLAKWYLDEALRITTIVTKNNDIQDADALLQWLQKQPTKAVPRIFIRRSGPHNLRDADVLERALHVLQEQEKIEITRAGKRVIIIVK